MSKTTIADIITTGLNNPDCAFFTGTFLGSIMIWKYFIVIAGLYIIMKFIDKLAVEPIIEWTKRKILTPKHDGKK